MIGGGVFIILPLLTVQLALRQPTRGWRDAFVRAALIWGVGIAVITELLSLFHALSFWPVLVVWFVAFVVTAVQIRRAWPGAVWLRRPDMSEGRVQVLAVGLAILAVMTLLTALCAPPNTPDALSYHLPRQLMWLQQGGVQHFETDDARALMMPPWAEMVQSHAMILSGGDGWANLPQWIAYALGMMVTSLLARELGAKRGGQWLAAFIFATLPMAYLQASSAKNDLIVAVWLAVLTWLALRPPVAERRTSKEWLMIGAALGLALATKTTAWIFAAPVMVVLVRSLVRDGRGALLVPMTVLMIAGPHMARNQAWFGTPLGIHRAEDGGAQGNEDFSWRGVVSNVARNVTLHLATPSATFNAQMKSGVEKIHRMIGQEPQDPRTTLLAIAYDVKWLPRNDTTAGAPVHAFLGALALLAGWVWGRKRGWPLRLPVLVVAGLLLYATLLKWQPWGARLHLPAFVLLAALVAWLVERGGAIASWACAALVAVGIWPSLEPDIRPLLSAPTVFAMSRWENYFRTQPEDRLPAERCLRALKTAHVELLKVIVNHGFPYPLMRRYLDEGAGRTRLWVARPEDHAVAPEGIVMVDRFGFGRPLYLRPPGAAERYRAAGVTAPFHLYLPESQARALQKELPEPDFVGWDRSSGLDRPTMAQTASGVIAVRSMSEAELKFDFRRESAHMAVRLVAANRASSACDLELRLDGKRIASVLFDANSGLQAVDVPLEPAGERGELTLSASPAWAGLIFSALQILDR